MKKIILTLTLLMSFALSNAYDIKITNNWCIQSYIKVWDGPNLLYTFSPISMGVTNYTCLLGNPTRIEIFNAGCTIENWYSPFTSTTFSPTCVNVAICGGGSSTGNITCNDNGAIGCSGGNEYEIILD